MPQIEEWAKFPKALRQQLIERMRDRSISLEDLNRLRGWIESNPEVPLGRLVQGFRIVQTLREWPPSENIPAGRSVSSRNSAIAAAKAPPACLVDDESIR